MLGARSSSRRVAHVSSLPRLVVKKLNICLRGHNDMCDIRWRAHRLSIDNIWTCCNQMDIMVTVRVGRRISGDTIYFSFPLQRTGMFASLSLIIIIIKHGLTLWVHRHNTLLPVNLRFQFEFKTYTRGGTKVFIDFVRVIRTCIQLLY